MATYHGLNEDETCRTFVLPTLASAGWRNDQIRPQYRINEGRLVATLRYHAHSEPLIADYVLEYGPDLPIGVVEAKRTRAHAADGIEQAKRYAQRLDLPFAYATNGRVIYEIDLVTGRQAEVDRFPSPDELWARHLAHYEIDTQLGEELLRAPYDRSSRNWDNSVKRPRYYQRLAVNRAISASPRARSASC